MSIRERLIHFDDIPTLDVRYKLRCTLYRVYTMNQYSGIGTDWSTCSENSLVEIAECCTQCLDASFKEGSNVDYTWVT